MDTPKAYWSEVGKWYTVTPELMQAIADWESAQAEYTQAKAALEHATHRLATESNAVSLTLP